MATLQTLDRGIKALFLIGSSEGGVTIGDVASHLGVDRAIAYRVVATLEANALITRQPQGRLHIGSGVLRLEAGYLPQLRAMVAGELPTLANATQATAFLSVADGQDCVAILVSEPEKPILRVGYRVGSRHPLAMGASGIAILSARPPSTGDSDAVKQARADGFCVSLGQLQKGAVGVAAPLARLERSGRPVEASVGVVAMEDLDIPRAARLIRDFARRIEHRAGGEP
ncbi:IclR family transcriptional regulator [Paracoccus sp. (in: a-proteobacteria)]|uniref:IclR family transcriptional regulator n=1 Tax=Paracoccus sp. TaxID=267 RepID=UPI003A8A0658